MHSCSQGAEFSKQIRTKMLSAVYGKSPKNPLFQKNIERIADSCQLAFPLVILVNTYVHMFAAVSSCFIQILIFFPIPIPKLAALHFSTFVPLAKNTCLCHSKCMRNDQEQVAYTQFERRFEQGCHSHKRDVISLQLVSLILQYILTDYNMVARAI